jgi:LmbE family N-acetylglucosaminyl deacetylase
VAAEIDLLVIAAHTDDAEFGIAGTVAKWTHEGKKVVYVVCTDGDKGTSDPNMSPRELAEIRQKEQQEAAEVLGVREVVFLGYPDQGLEDTAEFRKELVRQIRIFRPQTVAAPDPYRKYLWHRDHRIAGQVALDAVYPYARDHLAYPDLLAQGYQPHKVKEVLTWASEDPNYWVDISDYFETKISALKRHRSQVGGDDIAETVSWLKQWAEEAAKGRGFALAEEFHRVEIWD